MLTLLMIGRFTFISNVSILLWSILFLETRAFIGGGLNLPHPKEAPSDAPIVTPPPQFITESASLETFYSSFSGLTANTVVTQTIKGTPTTVPVWFCGPSETAAACKSCPSTTATLPTSLVSGPLACTSGFNGLFLVPIIPIPFPGGLPPPEGLLTLTIQEDGIVSTKDKEEPQKNATTAF